MWDSELMYVHQNVRSRNKSLYNLYFCKLVKYELHSYVCIKMYTLYKIVYQYLFL